MSLPLAFAGYTIRGSLYQAKQRIVLEAVSDQTGEMVALKTITDPFPHPSQLAALNREYRIHQRLDCPGVIAARDFITERNRAAIVFEMFPGRSLGELASAEDPLELGTVLGAMIAVSTTLALVHARNVIHRDIKPKNILLTEAGDTRLGDFGSAAIVENELLGSNGRIPLVGTLAYMSPEQTGRMNRSIDYRSDFYSLGVTLYELVTGTLPFGAIDPAQLVHDHLARNPVTAHDRNPRVPPMLSAIIEKLMAKRAEDRYQSAEGLVADLKECKRQWDVYQRITAFTIARRDSPVKFQISNRLVGRDQTIAELRGAWQRARGGARELVLLEGESGYGKSSLLLELANSIAPDQGTVCSGKGDRLSRSQPLRPILLALQDLVEQLLSSNEGVLTAFAQNIQKVMGDNLRLIVDYVPSLEQVAGRGPDIRPLPPSETENRFRLALLRFLSVFASEERPLLLFLDDLQWADPATLHFVEAVASGSEMSYCLLIGAFRTSEDYPELDVVVRRLESGLVAKVLKVGPLTAEDLIGLLSASMHRPREEVRLLADEVLRKTGGNPFFVREFLYSAERHGIISQNPVRRSWEWNTQLAARLTVTDNVAELIAERLVRLDTASQQVLVCAACAGGRFDANLLEAALFLEPAVIYESLAALVDMGVIGPAGAATRLTSGSTQRYRFAHDKLRDGALDLAQEATRVALHAALARALATSEAPNHFEVAGHFNRGRALIESPEERISAARFNSAAGAAAMRAVSYRSARDFYNEGLAYLPQTKWQTHHSLAFELMLGLGQSEYLLGDLPAADRVFGELLLACSSDAERAQVYQSLTILEIHRARIDQALEQGARALLLLGEEIPVRPGRLVVLGKFARTELALRGRPVLDLMRLRLADEDQQRSMALTMELIVPAYFVSTDLFTWLVLRAVERSAREGVVASSSFAFALYGVILAAGFGRYEQASKFGDLAIRIADEFGDSRLMGRALHVMGTGIRHWVSHIRDSLADLDLAANRYCLESGDKLYRLYALYFGYLTRLVAGDPLDHLLRDLELWIDSGESTPDTSNGFVGLRQICAWLMGQTRSMNSLSDDRFSQEAIEESLQGSRNTPNRAAYHILRMQVHFCFGDLGAAAACRERAADDLHGVFGQVIQPSYYLYAALVDVALAREGIKPGGTKPVRLGAAIRKFRKWSRHCPENYSCKLQLLLAEQASSRGRRAHALELYGRAIAEALSSGLLWDTALAQQLAGEHLLRNGNEPLAMILFSEAHDSWGRLGSLALVRRLEQRFPNLRSRRFFRQRGLLETGDVRVQTVSSETTARTIDLAAVVKASQAISSEIVQDRLALNLLGIVLENAGAQRGLLILQEDANLFLEAEADVENREARLRRMPLEQVSDVPRSLIHFVARTGEHVVVDDVRTDKRFSADPYFGGRLPVAILCAPIVSKARLIGIVYLENRVLTGAFTPDRLELLSILCSQAAVSIENARLYARMEERVLERTNTIQEQKKILEERNREMDEQIQLAQEIQESLLPQAIPDIKGASVAFRYVPMLGIGGDFVDLQYSEEEHRLGFFISDVSGHGVPAALLASMVKMSLSVWPGLRGQPSRTLEALHAALRGKLADHFLTAAVCSLDLKTGELLAATAGHPPLFIVRKTGEIETVRPRGRLIVDMVPTIGARDFQATLLAGDKVLLYTDGLVETRNSANQLLGTAGLESLLGLAREHSPEALCDFLLESMRKFAEFRDHAEDDVAIMVVEYRGGFD